MPSSERRTQAPRVVFLHGMLGQPSMFDAVRPPGSLALTLPGHGLAPWGTQFSTFDEVVGALAGKIAARTARAPLVLVGYSLGGRLALGLCAAASRFGLRIRDVVTVGAHLGLDAEQRAERRAWDRDMAELVRSRGLAAFVDQWQALPLFATQSPAQRERQRAGREQHDPTAIAWAFEAMGTGAMPSLAARLASPDRAARLHLCAGALDTKFTAIVHAAAKQLRRCDAHVVPDAGHNVVLEQPKAFEALLQRILGERGDSTAAVETVHSTRSSSP